MDSFYTYNVSFWLYHLWTGTGEYEKSIYWWTSVLTKNYITKAKKVIEKHK